MRKELKKMWVSKYALTDQVAEVMASDDYGDGSYFFPVRTCYGLKAGRDIHETKEAAEKAAAAMRAKKVKSLEKQIAQIKAAMA